MLKSLKVKRKTSFNSNFSDNMHSKLNEKEMFTTSINNDSEAS